MTKKAGFLLAFAGAVAAAALLERVTSGTPAPRSSHNTVDRRPVRQGSFLNLLAGQADFDPNCKGSTPAIDVEGIGLTCDPPPAGYASAETFVNGEGQDLGPSDIGRFYPFYKAPS